MQGSMKNGRRRIQTGIPEVPLRSLSLVVANQDIFRGNAKERDGIMKEEATEIKKAEEWQNWKSVADMQELTKKLASESGYAFSLESSNSEELATLEMRRHNFKNNDNDELVNVSNLLNVRQDLFMNLNSMVNLEKDDNKIFNVKYKLFKRDIYGLALVDTGNLVKGTLVFKEFWEMIGGNMSGKSNISVGTIEEEGLKY